MKDEVRTEVEQIKQQEDVKQALKQTTGTKEKAPNNKSNQQRKPSKSPARALSDDFQSVLHTSHGMQRLAGNF